jgi:large subunit ribosomal protein L10
MLTRQQKEELVAEVSEQIRTAKSTVFADYRGTGVNELNALKKDLRKEGVILRVMKKTLITRAANDAGVEFDAKPLDGQVAIVISMDDEVAAAKILADYGKETEKMTLLGGILGSSVLSQEQVVALSKIPSRDELRARLVGALKSPISGFVNAMAGNIRGFVQVLKAIEEKKA